MPWPHMTIGRIWSLTWPLLVAMYQFHLAMRWLDRGWLALGLVILILVSSAMAVCLFVLRLMVAHVQLLSERKEGAA